MFDVELLGDGDRIINELCHRLGEDYSDLCTTPKPCEQVTKDQLPTPPPSMLYMSDDSYNGGKFIDYCHLFIWIFLSLFL